MLCKHVRARFAHFSRPQSKFTFNRRDSWASNVVATFQKADSLKCFGCGQLGHQKSVCTYTFSPGVKLTHDNAPVLSSSSTNVPLTCEFCTQICHTVNKCFKKWLIDWTRPVNLCHFRWSLPILPKNEDGFTHVFVAVDVYSKYCFLCAHLKASKQMKSLIAPKISSF